MTKIMGLPSLQSCCNRLAHAALPSDYALLEVAGLTSGHPWAFLGQMALRDPGSVAYYRYLYGIARIVDPVNVLEIGTAFGMGSSALIQGAPRLRSFLSLDLGVFTRQYEIVEQPAGGGWAALEDYRREELVSDGRNIDFARGVLERLVRRIGSHAEPRLFRVNTQPGGSDNFDVKVKVPHWREVPELVRELETNPVDLLFIDGKHTGDGLYQDFKSFFPYVRPGGVVICDDLHDASYPYAWAGQTVASFERVLAEFAPDIADSCVWAFPQVPDALDQPPILRPWGLLRKHGERDAAGLPGLVPALGADGLEQAGPDLLAELRFLRRHADLLGEIDRLGLDDSEARRRLRFLQRHRDLFDELEAGGLADEAARRLRFVREHPQWADFLERNLDLFQELESRGLAEGAARRLRSLLPGAGWVYLRRLYKERFRRP